MNKKETTLPKYFCPAKWDDLGVNFDTGWAYACCKAKPTKFTTDVMEFISKERLNLLNDVRDSSCEYCWIAEDKGSESLRHQYLEKFDKSTFEDYKNLSKTPKSINISVGSECNFQCTYCNPKFSSKWEHDVRNKEYKVFTDRYFYDIEKYNSNIIESNISLLSDLGHLERIIITGGEPLMNKKTFQMMESSSSDIFQIVTNLSCKTSVLDRIFSYCERYGEVTIVVSMDATGKLAEFTRYGLDFEQFSHNMRYLLKNRPANVNVTVNSVMSSLTIRGLSEFGMFMNEFLSQPKFKWAINYCWDPKMQSMATLPDQYKKDALIAIDALTGYDDIITGLVPLKTIIEKTPFNKTMHAQLKHFMKEFAARKNIEIPLCLD